MRPEGEERLREEHDRIKDRYRDEKRKWRNWHGMTLEKLCTAIGWEREYRMWYTSFSNWTHADPQLAHDRQPGLTPDQVLEFAYHYLACMLQRLSNHGKLVLTNDQYQALLTWATPIT